MRLKYDIVFQKVGQKFIAVTLGEDARQHPGFIVLNESAKDIAERLRTDKSRDMLLAELLDDYDASAEEMMSYINMALDSLKDFIDE